ncbi:MAG: winged helix DNA-binding domain-containing protein [Actinomycetota bacterium]
MTEPFVPWRSTRLDRPAGTVADVARASLGLYATPPVSHLELAARVPKYRASMLDKAFANRKVVGLRALRGSAFLMPTEVVSVVTSATRDHNERAFASYLERVLVTATYATWSSRIDDLMADGVTRTVAEIKAALEPPEEDVKGLNYVVTQMATECRLVGTGAPKSWRSGQNTYARWEDWLPDVDPRADVETSRVALAEMYLDTWGPVTAADFAWWSGLTRAEASAALTACADPDRGGWFTPEGAREVKPPRGVRLLPWWDTVFVTWKDRARLIPEHLLPFVYDRDGNATSVVLVDGAVAGVWNLGADDRVLEITVAPFEKFTPRHVRLIEEEADVIRRVAGARSVEITRVTGPPNLADGRRNLFLRPLGL